LLFDTPGKLEELTRAESEWMGIGDYLNESCRVEVIGGDAAWLHATKVDQCENSTMHDFAFFSQPDQ
jgi:hypothetical protein